MYLYCNRQHSVSDNGSNKLFILDTEGNSGGNLVKQVKLTKPVYTGFVNFI